MAGWLRVLAEQAAHHAPCTRHAQAGAPRPCPMPAGIKRILKQVDLVVEVVDARAPQSTANDRLRHLLRGKRRVVALNKADLADVGACEVRGAVAPPPFWRACTLVNHEDSWRSPHHVCPQVKACRSLGGSMTVGR